MSFVSYAQNFEDVMLWRALNQVKNGTYVDVGAQHPVIDSVSKAFYEHGWKGIHIEPVLEYAELLRLDRPDEMVLQVALAEAEGTLDLYVLPNTGLTTAVEMLADRHRKELGIEHRRTHVPVLTLNSALQSLAGQEIHWLKIDVEGFEENVLKGWNSQTLRPWIMVIEATIALSPKTNYESWDPILTAANYQFVYFDGLNRFYVANEHAELAEAFSCPPNIFDVFELTSSSIFCKRIAAELEASQQRESHMQAEMDRLQNRWDTANAKIAELNQSSHHWRTVADGISRELQDVYASKSWTITLPLRKSTLALKRALALTVRVLSRKRRLAKPVAAIVPTGVPLQRSARATRIYTQLKKVYEARNN